MHWGSTRLRQIGAQLLAHLVLLGGLLLIRGTSGAAEVGLNKLQRPFLVMAVAGDHSQHENSWLDDRGHRNWDLLLIYYGSNEDFACPDCIAVVPGKGAKWRLMWLLTETDMWKRLADKYLSFMVADDDLLMSTHVINTSFQVFMDQGLLLGQPSVCSHANSHTTQATVLQHPGTLVTFTAMVEIMAPIFEAQVFKKLVIPTLEEAYFAWGLDYVWPFLLGYPHDKVGVVDVVCMTHPKVQQPKQSLYSGPTNPFGNDGMREMHYFLGKYGVNESSLASFGLPVNPGLAPPFGSIPLTAGASSSSGSQGAEAQGALPSSRWYQLGPAQVLLLLGALVLVLVAAGGGKVVAPAAVKAAVNRIALMLPSSPRLVSAHITSPVWRPKRPVQAGAVGLSLEQTGV